MESELHVRGRRGLHDEHKRDGRRRGRSGEESEKRQGAKTFRRGRALAFYEMMHVKSNALKRQLETPELQSINPILVGELKAVESLMAEFAQLFELVEVEKASSEEVIEEDTSETK